MADFSNHSKSERRLKQLAEAVQGGRLQAVRRLVNTLTAGEIADLLEALPLEPRLLVWEMADSSQDGEVLVHVNDEVRATLIEGMEHDELLEATSELNIDDLADILDDLPDQVTRQLLHAMDRDDRDRLEHVMSYPEDSAGGLMDPEVVTVRADVTLDVVLRYMKMRGDLPRPVDDLFVIDRLGRYMGRLPIAALLCKDPDTLVTDLIADSEMALHPEVSAHEVALQFEHQDWVSAPVVDAGGRLLGRVTVDDVVDVIREEAAHDVLTMAGLDEEEDMFAPVLVSSKRRALFLGLNLITALVAGWFVGLFGATLEQVVALAILMPVVASMGGIAGGQTLTLIIRGMATGRIGPGNVKALLNKEFFIGSFNGVFWAIIVGVVALLWFRDPYLSLVAALAILLNLIAGAVAGVVVPLTLKRFAIDPALAGGVVLTTVTDVVGFVSLLGLGTLILL